MLQYLPTFPFANTAVLAAHPSTDATFLFANCGRFLSCSFALMQKNQKSRQNPIAPRVFALPTPPRV